MPAKKTIFQRIGDDAVRARTKRVWKDWFSILDKFELKEKGHTQAARFLRDHHGLSDWWAQAVTIRYEWERGLRRQGSKNPPGKANAGAGSRGEAPQIPPRRRTSSA